jgi:hypothetical protein
VEDVHELRNCQGSTKAWIPMYIKNEKLRGLCPRANFFFILFLANLQSTLQIEQ